MGVDEGLVAPPVFKTGGPAWRRRPVGSIPIYSRHLQTEFENVAFLFFLRCCARESDRPRRMKPAPPGGDTHHKKRRRHLRPKGEAPIAKNVTVVDEHFNPLHPTYPRRARQLVKKGRAEWLDDRTIRLCPRPSKAREITMELESRTQIDWAAEFKRLIDDVIHNNEVTLAAIDAIRDAASETDDSPANAIVKIVEANNDFKIKALGLLQSMVWELKQQPDR